MRICIQCREEYDPKKVERIYAADVAAEHCCAGCWTKTFMERKEKVGIKENMKNQINNIRPIMLKIRDKKITPDEKNQIIQFYLEVINYVANN